MKIDLAYVCFDCREVQDRAPRGRCEKCGSDDIHPLASFVDIKKRDSVWRRLTWLDTNCTAQIRRPMVEKL